MRLGFVCDNPDVDFCYRYANHGNYLAQLHDHTCYDFFLSLDSGGIHYINGEERVLHEGLLVFVRPCDTHYFGPGGTSEPCHVNISFRPEIVDGLFAYLGEHGKALHRQLMEAPMPPFCILTQREKDHILSTLKTFAVPIQEETTEHKLRFRLFVAELISVFAQKNAFETEKNDGTPAWLESVCEKMCAHENFSEGISRMVELSGKTREHLARSMKKYKNVTLSTFVNNLRLEYVANMLLNSRMSIVDLCYDSGFASLDYFGKQFKKKYGVSPSDFRASMRNY